MIAFYYWVTQDQKDAFDWCVEQVDTCGPLNFCPPKVAEVMGKILHDLGFNTCECVQGGIHGHSWRESCRDHPLSTFFRLIYNAVLYFNGWFFTYDADGLARWEALAKQLDQIPAGSPMPAQALYEFIKLIELGLTWHWCVETCECPVGRKGIREQFRDNPMGGFLRIFSCFVVVGIQQEGLPT